MSENLFQVRGWRRLWPIASNERRVPFRSKVTLTIFIACFLPSLIGLFFLLVTTGVVEFGTRRGVPGFMLNMAERIDYRRRAFYLAPVLMESLVPALALTALVTTRSIAGDLRSRALELYSTRGVRPLGYFLSKWAGSVLMVGSCLVLAPMVLWLLGCMLAPETGEFVSTTARFMPRVVLGLLVHTMILTFLALCVSSLSDSPNAATVGWVVVVLGGAAMARVLGSLLPRELARPALALSPWDALARLGSGIGGLQTNGAGRPPAFSLSAALVGVSVYVVVLGLLAARSLRGVNRG